MRIIVILIVLLAAAPVAAQSLYRCVGKGGVSIQDHPCSSAQRTTKIAPATVPDDPVAAQRLREIFAEMDRRHSASRSSYAQSSTYTTNTYRNAVRANDQRDVKRIECQQAKQYRANTLEAAGLRRNFNMLRRLDNHVYERCKGL